MNLQVFKVMKSLCILIPGQFLYTFYLEKIYFLMANSLENAFALYFLEKIVCKFLLNKNTFKWNNFSNGNFNRISQLLFNNILLIQVVQIIIRMTLTCHRIHSRFAEWSLANAFYKIQFHYTLFLWMQSVRV